ncbi:hypothetical protein SK578_0672 [Streptococcus mitis]|uniref:Uncharacterized protein n=1 Tax=Streptococcus mitis TaxID=28037 RepID=A0A081QNQ4_STRMT|nr:hypothetical protein SK578_0672 [Streptococcus mitis]
MLRCNLVQKEKIDLKVGQMMGQISYRQAKKALIYKAFSCCI